MERSVTEYKDQIVKLIEDLENEHGVITEEIHMEWMRGRDLNQSRTSTLIDIVFNTDLT